MSNLFDYLLWRGDLTLEQDPLNEVDSLALSTLAYVNFDGIVPGLGSQTVSVQDAASQFFSEDEPQEERQDFKTNCIRLLAALADSQRFGSMLLTGYISQTDAEAEEQFAALTILPGDGSAYLSFRGTDETLVGWKEDFNMAFQSPVPSQQEAVHYLHQMADTYSEHLCLGGHSKGGNLAVYAATFCTPQVQGRIKAVYNNDGPGFLEQVLSSQPYMAIRERIHTLVPQSSVVGMLMEHEECYTVIHSTQTGLLQHNPFSWEVVGRCFLCLDTVTQSSRFFDLTLREWVDSLEPDQRGQFVDALFEILQATQARTVSELSTGWLKNAGIVLQRLGDVDDATRKLLTNTISALWKAAKKTVPAVLPKPSARWRPLDAQKPTLQTAPGPGENPPPADGPHDQQ